jgi:hypothetical protein
MPDPIGPNDLVGRGSNNTGFDYEGYGTIPDEDPYGQTSASDSDIIKENNENIGFADQDEKSKGGVRWVKKLTEEEEKERKKKRKILEDAEDEELWDYHNERKKKLLPYLLGIGYFIVS